MGRGRAKAKQTKVARELKYSTGGTDLERLRAELASGSTTATPNGSGVDDVDDVDGFGGDLAVDEYDDVEDDEAQPGSDRSQAR
jgi:hypothetical protein